METTLGRRPEVKLIKCKTTYWGLVRNKGIHIYIYIYIFIYLFTLVYVFGETKLGTKEASIQGLCWDYIPLFPTENQ